MIAEFELTQTFLENWGQRIWTASWQGGLLLALAWIICRAWKPLPAAHRCWIWRIAYLKFFAVMLLGGVLQLPILPTSMASTFLPSPVAAPLDTAYPALATTSDAASSLLILLKLPFPK